MGLSVLQKWMVEGRALGVNKTGVCSHTKIRTIKTNTCALVPRRFYARRPNRASRNQRESPRISVLENYLPVHTVMTQGGTIWWLWGNAYQSVRGDDRWRESVGR